MKNPKIKNEMLLQELEALCTKLDISIRYEKGDFAGGLCRIKDKRAIIINKNLSIDQKVKIIASELAKLETDDIFILPAIRELFQQNVFENTEN